MRCSSNENLGFPITRSPDHRITRFLSWPSVVLESKPCRGVAQPGSAPALGAGGRRFKSSRPDHVFPASIHLEIMKFAVLRCRSGFRLAARTPPKRLKFKSSRPDHFNTLPPDQSPLSPASTASSPHRPPCSHIDRLTPISRCHPERVARRTYAFSLPLDQQPDSEEVLPIAAE